MKSQTVFAGTLAPALIALVLFIAHLGEPFGGRRAIVELLLGLPLLVYLSAKGVRSRT